MELLRNGELDDEKLENLRSIAESVDLSTEGDEADILDRLNKYVDATGGGKKGGANDGKPPMPTKKKPTKKKRRGRPPKKSEKDDNDTAITEEASSDGVDPRSVKKARTAVKITPQPFPPPSRKRLRMKKVEAAEAEGLYGTDYSGLKKHYEDAFGEELEPGHGMGDDEIRAKLYHSGFMRKKKSE